MCYFLGWYDNRYSMAKYFKLLNTINNTIIRCLYFVSAIIKLLGRLYLKLASFGHTCSPKP